MLSSACESVGSVARYGIQVRHAEVTSEGWSECAGTGFDILRGGESDFRQFLVGLLARFYETASDMGGSSLFGPLYRMLAHKSSGSVFEPIREVMREVTLDTIPIGPGNELFGAVRERRLHLVYTAARAHRVQPSRLRNLLVTSGLVDPAAAGRSYNRIVLPAVVMEKFVADATDVLSFKSAGETLGVPRSHLERIARDGVITTIQDSMRLLADAEGAGSATTVASFRRADVVSMLDRLNALTTVPDEDGMVSIATASRRANCKLEEIFRHLLDGRFVRVARISDEVGFRSVRLDVKEVKQKTLGEDHGCLTLRQVSSMIPVTGIVLQALIDDGRIHTVRRKNPVKRYIQRVVEPEVLAAFQAEFVSLGSLSSRKRRKAFKIEALFAEAGVLPEFLAAGKKFYRRSDAERVLS